MPQRLDAVSQLPAPPWVVPLPDQWRFVADAADVSNAESTQAQTEILLGKNKFPRMTFRNAMNELISAGEYQFETATTRTNSLVFVSNPAGSVMVTDSTGLAPLAATADGEKICQLPSASVSDHS